MKKYLVYFTTKNGDYDMEWCPANSASEAEEIIRQDHWNIKSIDLVEEI